MGLVLKHIPGATLPLAPAPHYCLVELATARKDARLRAALESELETALEDGTVTDAAIAESEAQRNALWKLREEHAEAQKREGASVKNDVSVPVSRVPELLRRGEAAVAALIPGIRCVAFAYRRRQHPLQFRAAGGDGPDAFHAQDTASWTRSPTSCGIWTAVSRPSNGIGQLKPYMMESWRGGAELDAMRRIKAALDPAGLMNPGKVLP